MKTLHKKFYSIKFALLLLPFMLLLSACDDDDNDGPFPEQQSSIKVINGVFNSPEYDVKVNGSLINEAPLTFKKSTSYKAVPAGKLNIAITEKSSGNEVSTATIDLAANQAQSVYTVTAAADAKVEIFAITDDFTPPSARKAKVRFVNVDARSKPLDVYITGQTTPIFKSVPAKGATPFIDIDPSASQSFTLVETGGTAAIAILAGAVVEEGKFYTLWGQENGRSVPLPSTTLGFFNNR